MSIVPGRLGSRRINLNVNNPLPVQARYPIHSQTSFLIPIHSQTSFPIPPHGHTPIVQNETMGLGFINVKIECEETPEAHILTAQLPGVRKDEVKVEVAPGRVLKISGERSVERKERGEKWHHFERSGVKFERAYMLPENARVDKLKADMEGGVLTVTVPKWQLQKPFVNSVQRN